MSDFNVKSVIKQIGADLNESDFLRLEASFIPTATAASVFRRVGDEQGAGILLRKRNAAYDYSGLAAAITNPTTGDVLEYEIRRDKPDKQMIGGREKITGKYLRAVGSKSLPYFVSKTNAEHLSDATVPMVIVEGIKKALACERALTNDYSKPLAELIVGLQGVDNFKIKQKRTKANGEQIEVKDLLPELANINFDGRETIILFDANRQPNKNVFFASYRLAETLQSRGAIVYFVDLPQGIEGVNGIDDLLGVWEKSDGTKKAIEKFGELLKMKKKFVADAVFSPMLCNENLQLKAEQAMRGNLKITILDSDGSMVGMDEFNIAAADKRTAFIKKQIESFIKITDSDRKDINRELMRFSSIAEFIMSPGEKVQPHGEQIETSFKVLSDGQIFEQIRGGFALYDPDGRAHEIVSQVTDADGTIYVPVKDDMFHNPKALYLADDLTEYGTTESLDADIQAYLHTYIDLQPLYLALTAKYILFTYLFDKTMELSYLNPTGAGGSGKSRFGLTVTIASRRGLLLSNPSASSIYRTVSLCKPTVFIDEFNSSDQTDDAKAIIQVLNSGYQDLMSVPRSGKNADGNFDTDLFDPYCPKIIGSLKQSGSNPFNTRCIEIKMQATTRNDLPIRLSRKLLEHARTLRNKLTLFRLRNYHEDFESRLDKAEIELKSHNLTPRSIQVNIPLIALIENKENKADYIDLLKGRDRTLVEEKSLSLEGEIIDKIHSLLFEVDEVENSDGEHQKIKAEWNRQKFPELPKNGKICAELLIEKILLPINATRPKGKEIFPQTFGKNLLDLGFHTEKLTRRKAGENRLKKALVFDYKRLNYLFNQYKLPVPDGFYVTNVTKTAKPHNNNELDAVTLDGKEQNKTNQYNQSKLSNNKTSENGYIGYIEIPETSQEKEKTHFRGEI